MRTKNQTLGEQAARFSLYAPFVAFLIGAIGRGARTEPGVAIALFSINMLLILAGFALGIFALVSIRRYGSQYILGRAIGGLLLNGIVIAALILFLLPPLLAGSTKAKVPGHWHMRSVAAGPANQIDVTFNPDGTFHFVGSNGSASFFVDGRWVLTPSRVIGLTIERADGGAFQVGQKIGLGKVSAIDDKVLVLGTDKGDEVYDRIP
ncbi:MAG TPA: hypothetical protein VG269_21020 [Tepidisphaeraceae bacterium]|jgi:hypothetical protein|nr:hypothetical protein [Tepidisphaeraceae bacterium]